MTFLPPIPPVKQPEKPPLTDCLNPPPHVVKQIKDAMKQGETAEKNPEIILSDAKPGFGDLGDMAKKILSKGKEKEANPSIKL